MKYLAVGISMLALSGCLSAAPRPHVPTQAEMEAKYFANPYYARMTKCADAGRAIRRAISRGHLRVGMWGTEVERRWGMPKYYDEGGGLFGNWDVWRYSGGTELYFADDKLISWVNLSW